MLQDSNAEQLTEGSSDTIPDGLLTVATTRFGEVTVARDKVIHLTVPFLGFPDSHRFFLKPHGVESPFMWLQSLEMPKLAFVVVQPAMIIPQYQPHVPASVKEELKIDADQDLEMLLILTIPQGRPQDMTANLLGPVLINAKKRLARQFLLDPLKYDPCWKVFVEE